MKDDKKKWYYSTECSFENSSSETRNCSTWQPSIDCTQIWLESNIELRKSWRNPIRIQRWRTSRISSYPCWPHISSLELQQASHESKNELDQLPIDLLHHLRTNKEASVLYALHRFDFTCHDWGPGQLHACWKNVVSLYNDVKTICRSGLNEDTVNGWLGLYCFQSQRHCKLGSSTSGGQIIGREMQERHSNLWGP